MIADIILIVIMALCIFLGYKRGLIKVAVRIIGFFAALIIALIFYTPVSNYIINNTEIVSNLEQTIENKMLSESNLNDEKKDDNANFLGSIEKYTSELQEKGTEYVAENLAISIVRARNLDRSIYSSKNNYVIYKDICKYNRRASNYKTI